MAETEIVETLTEDEEIILTVAADGNPMIPIGRWEKPVDSLLARGLLVANPDRFNARITEAGRDALARNQSANMVAFADARAKIAAQPQARKRGLGRLAQMVGLA